jgi:hypothetical protein
MASRAIPQAYQRIYYSLLYLILIHKYFLHIHHVVKGNDCLTQSFPVILGFDSGETEIKFMDQDPLSSLLFFVGTTTATELKVAGAVKSVFIA